MIGSPIRLGGVGEHVAADWRLGHRVPTPSFVSSRWLSRDIVYDPTQNRNATNTSVSAYSRWPGNSAAG